MGDTIHQYYSAIRRTWGENVDLDIHYRKSTDGYTFTDDTLIYTSPGDEYSPLGVVYDEATWSVYVKGPMAAGKAQSRGFRAHPNIYNCLAAIRNT